MILESSGATPFGIFLLADEYLQAAHACLNASPRGRLTQGPARLLAYHACELFLKAHLRSHGCLITELRALNHDLQAMLTKAMERGLKPRRGLVSKLGGIAASNDYVRVRYSLRTEQVEVIASNAVNLAEKIRESVRIALDFDEFGNPKGELWAGPMPKDYP